MPVTKYNLVSKYRCRRLSAVCTCCARWRYEQQCTAFPSSRLGKLCRHGWTPNNVTCCHHRSYLAHITHSNADYKPLVFSSACNTPYGQLFEGWKSRTEGSYPVPSWWIAAQLSACGCSTALLRSVAVHSSAWSSRLCQHDCCQVGSHCRIAKESQVTQTQPFVCSRSPPVGHTLAVKRALLEDLLMQEVGSRYMSCYTKCTAAILACICVKLKS